MGTYLYAHRGIRPSTHHPRACLGATGCWAAPCQPRGVGTQSAIPGAGLSCYNHLTEDTASQQPEYGEKVDRESWILTQVEVEVLAQVSPRFIAHLKSWVPTLPLGTTRLILYHHLGSATVCVNSPRLSRTQIKFGCFSPPHIDWARQSHQA